ncbi:MAG: adenylyltransferase [Candidatus Marinimicrobia bacterium]|nr:adenylyltransferase [Candidatus Neomarinimicrobiota bacterium]
MNNKSESNNYKNWVLTDRQICDLELIIDGSFSPLKGFLNEDDYNSVLDNMKLTDGSIWPIPINLDVNNEFIESISDESSITLRDKEGFAIAILDIESKWKPNKENEVLKVYQTNNQEHPGVHYIINQTHDWYIGGKIRSIQNPKHYDYTNIRLTPSKVKEKISKMGWDRVVAFQTRNPMHRAHVEITHLAAKENNANLLIHPVVGMTKPGDVDYFTRVRCYNKIIKKYPIDSAMLSLLPLSMRMAGPREALWHALIRKNYGCTHIIIGRDHAGPGSDSNGDPFYGPYDAQDLLVKYQDEINIEMVPFKMMVYVKEKNEYMPIDEVPNDLTSLNISGTELRNKLDSGDSLPEWFTYPEIEKELKKSIPEKVNRGITVFFTGLSGSGKSTLANALMIKFLEEGNRPVTLLDGDLVRQHLSSELGFSKEHRSINVKRIGYVASEITKNRGIAICAPIAPYESDRNFNKQLISKYGGYIEVFVSTPLEVCEQRDSKGLYALARKGVIKEFTGISDPYEEPENPDIIIDSSKQDPEILIEQIINKIKSLGYMDE